MKKQYLLLIVFFLAFFIFRIVYIFRFPLVTDEATYIRWGQVMIANPQLRWAMSYHHKQPLVLWVFGLASLFTGSVDYGPRIISLFLAYATAFAIYKWVKILASREIALTALMILAITPLFVHFQSLALLESMVLAATAFTLWFFTGYQKTGRVYYLVCLGVVFGVGFWTKTNLLILAAVIMMILIFDWIQKRKKPATIFILCIPLAVAFVIVLPLAVQAGIPRILIEAKQFTFSGEELIGFPFWLWMRNVFHVLVSSLIYGGPLLLFSLIVYMVHKRSLQNRPVFLVSFVLFLVPILMNKVFSTRYYLPAYIPLLPFAGIGLEIALKKANPMVKITRFVAIGTTTLMSFVLVLYAPWFFSLFPRYAVFESERGYAFDWSSGYATRDAYRFLEQAAQIKTPAALAVPDYQGNPTDYLVAKYYTSRRFLITFLDTPKDFTEEFSQLPPNSHIYYVTRPSILRPYFDPYMTKLASFPTPDGNDAVEVYEVLRDTIKPLL